MVARDQDLRLPQLFDCQIEDPHQAHQLTQEEEVKQWSAVRVSSLCSPSVELSPASRVGLMDYLAVPCQG